MRRFYDACKLICWNERHITSALAADDNDLLLIDDFIQDAGQILARRRVQRR